MSEFEIDAALAADIAKFEVQLSRYLAGELEEDVFRVFRLNNGIYGQRQGGHNQMIRIKAPYGTITAAQLDRMGDLATEYSRPPSHPVPFRPTRTGSGSSSGHRSRRHDQS